MKRPIFIVLLMFFSFFHLPTSAEEKNTLVVAIGSDGAPPWEIINPESITGIDIEIINRIGVKLGMPISYRRYPFARCIKNMEEGTVDLMAYLSFKEERTSFMRYIQPAYMNGVKAFFVLKDNGKKIAKYEDLFGLTVGVIRGTKHHKQFDTDQRINHIEVTSTEQMLSMLLLKRLDAVIDNDTGGLYHINRLGLNDKIAMAEYTIVLKNNGYFAFSKNSKHLDKADAFELALKEMQKNGEIERIVQQFIKR